MLKLIDDKEIKSLYIQKAMFPEDWLKAQLKADARAILDKTEPLYEETDENPDGKKRIAYCIRYSDEEYQQLQELAEWTK